jgi:hypothetical protein
VQVLATGVTHSCGLGACLGSLQVMPCVCVAVAVLCSRMYVRPRRRVRANTLAVCAAVAAAGACLGGVSAEPYSLGGVSAEPHTMPVCHCGLARVVSVPDPNNRTDMPPVPVACHMT